MSGWMRRVLTAGRTVEDGFDRLRFEVRRRTGRLSSMEILPYRGHGNDRELFLKGRVLETLGLPSPNAEDSRRRNLRSMARRFLSSEVPKARVRALYAGQEIEAKADKEGYFDLRFSLAEPLEGDASWRRVRIELVWPHAGGESQATGKVLVPTRARFGVISDLDDTVLQSNVTNFLKMARVVLLGNAHTRLPFEGVAAFYRALQRGASGGEFNPIFYVSSSPWNLYDLLEDFMDLHGVPAGPLFLRDWSPTALKGGAEHKLRVIRMLLATYPELPFVLIGDSGERDPEIYQKIVLEYPGRIRAVYIRDVTGKERDKVVHEIARRLRNLGVEMLLVPNTVAAVDHAADQGLISSGLRFGA